MKQLEGEKSGDVAKRTERDWAGVEKERPEMRALRLRRSRSCSASASRSLFHLRARAHVAPRACGMSVGSTHTGVYVGVCTRARSFLSWWRNGKTERHRTRGEAHRTVSGYSELQMRMCARAWPRGGAEGTDLASLSAIRRRNS